MRVLIYGVNSINKGAQLLLASAASRLIALGHVPVVSARDVNAETRWQTGARGIFSVEKFGPLRSLGLDRIPRVASSRLPIAGDASFDFVLDASGFSLTDSWGMAPISSRLSRLSRWKKKGIGFAMLPQAFGPFELPDVALGVRGVFDSAEHIWARDPVSYEYVARAGGSPDRLEIAPDITIGSEAHANDAAAGATLLVPNWNLARRSGEGGRETYISSLVEVAVGLRDRGKNVVGLCHEGPRDLEIIEAVAAVVPGMTVLNPASGTECKNIIAGSDLVIAGRYHALVSALSTGVPAIGHSWSHKYKALFDDFGVQDGLADPLEASSSLERVDSITPETRGLLAAALPGVGSRVDQTWRTVAAILDAH